jgi:hypothetical protein
MMQINSLFNCVEPGLASWVDLVEIQSLEFIMFHGWGLELTCVIPATLEAEIRSIVL